MQTINLQLPTGYRICEKNHTLKIHKALDLLLSEKQACYIKAINNHDGTATLFYRVIRCPCCGCEMPVRHTTNEILDRDTIAYWGAGQLSLFEPQTSELKLNNNFSADETVLCPQCKVLSHKEIMPHNITITHKKGKIRISHEINNAYNLLRSKWAGRFKLEPPFIYCETLVFNLQNGHTHIQLTNKKGDIIVIRDVTESPEDIKHSILYDYFTTNHRLRKEIKKVFKSYCRFGFHTDEISFEKLVLATRFVGYNPDFYHAIPYLGDTYKLFPNFRSIAKAMHYADKIPDLYKRLNLPSNKATRKIIFLNPGLMFYHREINMLYHTVGNIDYFNRVLSFDHIYYILAKINCYPVIDDFIREAFRFESPSVVMRQLEKNWWLWEYALIYMSMNDYAKKYERQKKNWLTNNTNRLYYFDSFDPAVPSVIRNKPFDKTPNCRIGGYEFEWLISSRDYKKAGKVMNNCLASVYSPVMAIKSNQKYIAAFSFDKTRFQITEARLCQNQPLHEGSPVYNALQKWCKRYNVKWEEPQYDNYAF